MKFTFIFKYTLFCLLLINSLAIYSQLKQTNRVEFEVNWTEGYNVFQFGKNGIVTFDKKDNKSDRETIITYSKFNRDLHNQEEKTIAFKYVKGKSLTYAQEKLYTLTSNPKKGVFTIITTNPEPFKLEKTIGALLPKFLITKFVVHNDIAYMSGLYKKNPKLVLYNLKTKSSNYIDLDNIGQVSSQISDIYLSKSGEVHIVISNCDTKNSCVTTIIPFDSNGKRLQILSIDDTEKYKISSAKASPTSTSGEYLVTGTYSIDSYSSAKGIYFSKYKNGVREYVNFYDFLEFKNFLSYLPDRKQKKITKKSDRKRKKGKELKLEFKILLHEVIELGDESILIGEAYYPTYRTVTYTTYVNGSPVMSSYQVFDGYQYSHVVVSSYSKDGSMNWNNSFEMWLNYKPYYLKKFINTSITNNIISLLICDGSRIQSSKIENGEIIVEKEQNFIQTGDGIDEVKWTIASEMEHWYDNYFVAYGYQKIKNSSMSIGKKNRKIFYMNKIKY